MTTHRMDKVNSLIREEVGRILLMESKDPRFTSVTVTDARVSADLYHAKVFVSILGDETQRDNIMHALRRASGFVRKTLGDDIRLKRVPQITFIYDESLERANQIYKTLEQLDLGDEQ